MKIYNYSQQNGVFTGSEQADESPLEPGEFLIPSNATSIAPPVAPEGMQAVWDGSDWTLQNLPSPPVAPPIQEPLTQQEQTNMDSRAFLAKTDWYVIRKMETGEPIPQEILDNRAEARASVVEQRS